MSAAKPLGIQANQLDMGTSSGRALNSGVYLDSTGNLGLGDIKSVGEIRAENVAGNISVVGDVVSPTLISLQADGAVRGIGGTWVDGEWVADAGMLHAPAIAVRAQLRRNAHALRACVDAALQLRRNTTAGELPPVRLRCAHEPPRLRRR